MLSGPVHRFSSYHATPPTDPGIASSLATARYSLPAANVAPHRPSVHESARPAGAAGPVRRRISRACDQCNQLRTKCDGRHPCAHCTECGLGCEYARERKKRGKVSRKDRALQAAAQAAATASDSSHGTADQHDSPPEGDSPVPAKAAAAVAATAAATAVLPRDAIKIQDLEMAKRRDLQEMSELPEMAAMQDLPEMADVALQTPLDNLALDGLDNMDSLESLENLSDLNGYTIDSLAAIPIMGPVSTAPPAYAQSPVLMPTYADQPYSTSPFGMDAGILAYPMTGQPASPPWLVLPPSPQQQYQMYQSPASAPAMGLPAACKLSLRYPVLEPLAPHLNGILPLSLACDLLDVYFEASSTIRMHPTSPYVLTFIFRKASFLRSSHPRRCRPSLLASMLWVAAQTSDDPFLTGLPASRGNICQKLLELTVGLLKPLVHTSSGSTAASTGAPASSSTTADRRTPPSPRSEGGRLCNTSSFGADAGGMTGVSQLIDQHVGGNGGVFGMAATLDDIVTYIHLATVVSASEYKGASVRWWNAAWTLARELKLGRELPRPAVGGDKDACVTEETREERRRVWWLVYMMDRHLALCYNRPLFLLDAECSGLLQPMDDAAWQKGAWDGLDRPRGPIFSCRGHCLFGFFLPLMTILGEIVDLHHARNHPRFGAAFRASREWDDQVAAITRHLGVYEQSLRSFARTGRPASASSSSSTDGTLLEDLDAPMPTPVDEQTHIAVAYGTHVLHVLHVLLTGKWDPVSLLDDDDSWIRSAAFVTATGHAIAAAEATGHILEHDLGLEVMPFFFGIYLLQGSLLLLLIADRLPREATPGFARACETIVRAHEACVVTLHTEYQRTFSRVMRSALAQVRGRGGLKDPNTTTSDSMVDDTPDTPSGADNKPHRHRRELLGLYRWTGDGTGLAL